ncbi:MAG: hypothetical protein U9N52_12490 [Campylobacterota bacterium]|nr:hypothetical protein [Campylobacterota bacterium]
MSEPSLHTIEDYNTLEGEKKRIVWAVIIAGLIIGAIFATAKVIYSTVDDEIKTEKIGYLPAK